MDTDVNIGVVRQIPCLCPGKVAIDEERQKMKMTYPGKDWERRAPDDLGLSGDRLAGVETWLRETHPGEKFRIVIARDGYLAAEWNQGVETDEQLGQASASKSYFSCMLGIAVEQGKVPSPDAKVIDFYPEMMDIAEDEGPKPGRYPFDKDRDITFRQLICNTSGYMKPGEEPGKVFHYQTFGMNILTNSIATIYGFYDSRDPKRLPGCGQLIEDYIRDPIQATWRYSYNDFEHPPQAKKNIFGHSLRIVATARDTARAGHLWLNWGNWNGVQVIPETYLKEGHRHEPVYPRARAGGKLEIWSRFLGQRLREALGRPAAGFFRCFGRGGQARLGLPSVGSRGLPESWHLECGERGGAKSEYSERGHCTDTGCRGE